MYKENIAQAGRMSDPGPVEEDILINKLRPGHELQMRLFAVKVEGLNGPFECTVSQWDSTLYVASSSTDSH
jgi:hypothetical protein